MRKIEATAHPVQVWAPRFFASSYGDFMLDLQRAYKEWQNEDIIWLMPDAKKVIRWKTKRGNFLFYEAIVPSKALNSITIYHIDKDGRIYPPFKSFTGLKKKVGSGLYKVWLEKQPLRHEAPDSVAVLLPVIKNGKFCRYEKKEIETEPGPIIPFAGIDKDGKTVLSTWPPPYTDMLATISPDIESKDYYGKLRLEKLKYKKGDNIREINTVSSEKEQKGKAISVRIKWPEPFDKFFPDGGTWDLLYQHEYMKHLIRKIEEKEIEKATQEVERYIKVFTGDTNSFLEKTSFAPKAMENKEALLIEAKYKYGIDANNFDELIKSIEFTSLAAQRVKVKRIYSWLGYFWWELYRDISSYKNIRFCSNCGSIISGGRSDRIYCSKEENIKCFKQRQAIRQKKRYYKNH